MVSTDVTAFQLPSAEHQVQLRRAVIASTIGTAIEGYDFRRRCVSHASGGVGDLRKPHRVTGSSGTE